MPFRYCALLLFSCVCFGAEAGQTGYVGPEVCATCHSAIAGTQRKTAMAGSWQTGSASALKPGYDERLQEGKAPGIAYRVRRTSGGFSFETKMPGEPAVTLPVEALVGGPRHGISFLTRVEELGGIPLQRPAMVEGRYAFSTPHKRLIVSPGFPMEQPQSYETAFGSVLSPSFEKKCLTCHGQPATSGAGQHGGVGCESCHGPGLAHVQAMSKGNPAASIVNPRKLTNAQAMEVCAQCHTGFSPLSDPLPDDLLISSQVTALRNSECFIQSGEAIRCTSCHNPHEDAGKPQVTATSEKTCLSCHSTAAKPQASICPVNAKEGCVGCHMPAIQKGAFAMVDHWIGIHPEHGGQGSHSDGRRSEVRPVREYLRILLAANRENAERAKARLANGESFFDVASQLSIDPSRQAGGFLGATTLADLDPRIADAAAQLDYGETSGILELPNGRMIIRRLPREFRLEADRLFQEAVSLKAKGDVHSALEKDQQALKVNPSLLRALIFMGGTLGETGQVQRAANVLTVATQLFPKDSDASFDLGIVLGTLGKTDAQIQAFRRALELDENSVPVYESLGAALQTSGDTAGAIKAFREGLRVNPLSATLNFDLSLVLDRQGDQAGARAAKALAFKIDPKVVPESK